MALTQVQGQMIAPSTTITTPTIDTITSAAATALTLQSAGTTAVTIDTSQRAAFVAGTAALPAITTAGDTNTGIWFPAADTIAFSEGGAEAMRIDSSGYVTMPNQPSFMVSFSATGTVSLLDNTLIPFNNKTTGSCYDVSGSFNTTTSRFTAPVTGVYLLQVSVTSATSGGYSVKLKKNGSDITNGTDTMAGFMQNDGTSGITMITTVQVQLSSSDYIEAFTRNGAYTVTKNHSWMLGRLLG
jgi:hypothetical protein